MTGTSGGAGGGAIFTLGNTSIINSTFISNSVHYLVSKWYHLSKTPFCAALSDVCSSPSMYSKMIDWGRKKLNQVEAQYGMRKL